MMKEKPLLEEFAPPNSHHGWKLFLGAAVDDTISQILRSESASSRPHASIYNLFNEMEDKDGHLFSVIQTRKIGILSRDRRIVPHSNAPGDLELATFVESVINEIPSFEQSMFHLLDALAKGFAVLEILWDVDRDGKVAVRQMKSRFQGRFIFGEDGELRLLDPPDTIRKRASVELSIAGVKGSDRQGFSFKGIPVPKRKFLVFTFNAQHDNPYGKGLCARAYWYYWFKKNNLKFWAIFNEKFGSPTVVARYHPGISEEEHRKLLDIIDSLQTDTGVTIPENIMLEFLEAHRSGSINSYKDMAEWCNDEISKIVLGQTLTSGEGRRSGSLALGKIHQVVRFEYIEADARALMDMINDTLIPWIVEFNFGTVNRPLPRFEIDTTPEEELDRQIEIDRQLINLGVSLPLHYFYKKYKRPMPMNDQRVLRYDDNNLYQYHLQYGVLTINEVRATLGLDPVPWGDQRPLPWKAAGEGNPAAELSHADSRLEEHYPEMEELKHGEP
jgi:phage gp29-like protein